MPALAKSKAEKTLSIFMGREECLLEGGAPNPLKNWQNLEFYGYDCPRTQYVQHPYSQSLTKMAREWGLTLKTLQGWKNSQRWDLLRKNYWAKIADNASESEAASLARTQKSEVIARIGHWKTQREQLLSELRANTVEAVSPTGKKIERRLDPGERAQIAKTIALCEAQLDKCLGMSGLIPDEKKGEPSKLQVNGVIINISTPGQAQSEPKELPQAQVWEALPPVLEAIKPDSPVWGEEKIYGNL